MLLVRLFLLLLCILLVAGGGGAGVMALKNRIAVTAKQNKSLEVEIDELSRTLHSLEAELAKWHNPETLREQAAQLGLGPPIDGQIVVLEDPIQPK